MSDTEWIDRAAAAIARYLPNFHPDDAVALADDLQCSWPTLSPEDAVQFFFWPVQPETGAFELCGAAVCGTTSCGHTLSVPGRESSPNVP